MSGYTIDYLEFPSADNGKSRDFFGKAFGWTFIHYGDTYDEISGAGIGTVINADPEDRSAAPIAVIRTTDIERAERDVVAAGGVITRKPYDFPGGRRFYFREPGGAELAVYKTAE